MTLTLIYCIGLIIMLTLCGAVLNAEPRIEVGDLIGCLILSVLWFIFLPIIIGMLLKDLL